MTNRTAHRRAIVLAAATSLFLVWGIGALGVISAEGDRTDLLFLVVLALVIGGGIVTRLRPRGMARVMLASAMATMTVGLVAIALGKHHAAGSSVLEILGLTAMYASLYAASAWLFREAA